MGKLNLLVHLNAYRDTNATNNPSLNNFKWTRDSQGIEAEKAKSEEFSLAPGESKTLFNGSRTISHDNTTTYDISLKLSTANTYVLEHNSGTAPAFRAKRTTGADATTQITVVQDGPVTTFSSTGGTALNLIVGGAIVGDEIRIGDLFAAANQGKFKIISLTATSLSIENSGGSEGPITLGAGFDDQIRIYSAAGVQAGDKINISAGLSPVSFNTYEVTDVWDDRVEFFSAKVLPEQTAVMTTGFAIYSSAKKLVYLESDKKMAITTNGVAESALEPFVDANVIRPGILLKRTTAWSMVIVNSSTDMASLFFASVE